MRRSPRGRTLIDAQPEEPPLGSIGVGVERTFPLHTPIVDRVEVVTRGDVRRAKLYYLRELRGKAAKIREKRETPAHA